MSKAKHTPGPWRLFDEIAPSGRYKKTVRWLTIHADETDGECIAEVTGDDLSDDERIANAHLIAAAPDLLEAAKAMDAAEVRAMRGGRGNGISYAEAVRMNRAAIAKAEGKTDVER